MQDLLRDNYGDRHRAFLQALAAHGTLTHEEGQPIIAAIMTVANGEDGQEVRPDQVSESMFLDFIEMASRAASLFDYEVRSAAHQVTKKRIYALVNTTSDPQTQLATTYSPEELSFIKRVLDQMFEKLNRPRIEAMCITEMQAIKLARPSRRESHVTEDGQSQAPVDRGLKHSEVEDVLASLVDGGWFEKSRDGFLSLTPRALIELRPWLVDMYNDPDADSNEWQRIKFCEGCKDIITYGLRCSEPDCHVRLHDICQEAFWRSRRGMNCPKCSTQWRADRYVGERAITMTEAYRKEKRRSSGFRRGNMIDEIVQQEDPEDESEREPDETLHEEAEEQGAEKEEEEDE